MEKDNTAVAENIIEIVDAKVKFDALEVLNIPYVAFEKNKRYFIKGESGTGKTTLFNIISGLLVPTEGSVFVDNVAVNTLSEKERDAYRANNIGYIFQDFNLFDGFTALENVLIPATFCGNGESFSQSKKKALEALSAVGLADKSNVKVNKMSGGEKQRVAIARAIINIPTLLLADEPTGNLDRRNSTLIMQLLLKLSKEKGCTLLLISHDLSLSDSFDEVVDIYDFNNAKED